ncbi:MAG: hypothetical protein AAFP84_09205 [Actinomycetota bacterium]
MFVGAFERQLDERGRVALPSAFREGIGTDPYLAFGADGCVQVLSTEQFRSDADELVAGVKTGSVSRQRARAFAASAMRVKVDKQGRVTLESRLRDHAGLQPQSPVVVLGSLDRVELWEPTRYEHETEAGTGEFAAAGTASAATDPTDRTDTSDTSTSDASEMEPA